MFCLLHRALLCTSAALLVTASLLQAQGVPPAVSPKSPQESAPAQATSTQVPAEQSPKVQRAIGVLQELSRSLEAISSQVGRAVVQIFARGYLPPEEGESDNEPLTSQRSSGSGIILSADGYILTNSHVVLGARNLKVQLSSLLASDPRMRSVAKSLGRALPAKVIGIDRETDLAVLKIEQTGLPHLTFGDSDQLRQGQLVLALGNPLGLEGSASLGVVSAVARQLKPDDPMIYIQTDAPINPGNSGGPLIDAEGKVVGINTFILSQSGGNEGLGFAIPSNIARSVFAQIRQNGRVHRAQLGLNLQSITSQLAEGLRLTRERGVVISDVEPGGPADKAGIKIGDIILALNGKSMETTRQLENAIYRQPSGGLVTLRVLRGEQRMDFTARVEERSDDVERLADMVDSERNLVVPLGILGLGINKTVLQMLPDLRRERGVVVAARTTDSPYSGLPLEVGDVIYSVNRTPVASVDELRSVLDAMKSNEPAVLQIERDGKLIYIAIEIE